MKKRVVVKNFNDAEVHIELNEGDRAVCSLHLTMEEADSLFSDLERIMKVRRYWQEIDLAMKNKQRINGRLPIRYAVIKLGYELLGAGRTKCEAITNAEKREPNVRDLILPDEEERVDGEIFVTPINADYDNFDDYFTPDNSPAPFEKIEGNWYAIYTQEGK